MLKQAKLELAALGLSINKRDGEYRVAFRGNYLDVEASAYYTDDLADAVSTGCMMAARRATQGSN